MFAESVVTHTREQTGCDLDGGGSQGEVITRY